MTEGFVFTAKSDINKAIKDVGRFYARQVPFAAARAMTQTAKKIEQIERLEMQRVFNKTSRYTLNAQFVKPAKKSDFKSGNMHAVVWLIGSNRKRDRHYLEPHVYGGQREHTRFEDLLIKRGIMAQGQYAIPGRHMGKITRGMYQKILSQLRASNDIYSHASNSARSKRSRRAMAFFINRKASPPAIWMRKGRRVVPAFVFVNRARYPVRLRYFEVAQKVSSKYWPGAFDRSLRHAIKTAR